MAFVDDFRDMMADTCQFSPLSSRDSYAVPTFGSATSFNCRLVRKNRMVRDAKGQIVVSTARVWLQGHPNITPEDRVTLSDGSNPVIVSVERESDEFGSSHTVVNFL